MIPEGNPKEQDDPSEQETVVPKTTGRAPEDNGARSRSFRGNRVWLWCEGGCVRVTLKFMYTLRYNSPGFVVYHNTLGFGALPQHSRVWCLPSHSRVWGLPSHSRLCGLPQQVWCLPQRSRVLSLPQHSRVVGLPQHSTQHFL